ncbi:patatin-like phospholipase family protein [Cutibacterium sp. V947]|uniref:patatin-like phospholipase family protein n=1 Tax=unclassified Cutibacterium TaxID=2649671 RepID=UPI003EE1B88D
MELPSWLGIPTLAFGLGSRTPQQGLVLAGGGSKASFQMGALRHLYDVVGIAPTAMVATSAGSIVACTLAQWTDPAKQAAALRQLETMWLEMTGQSDMFTPRAWFARLLEKGPEWMSLLNREAAKAKSPRPWMSLPFHRGGQETKVPDPAEPVAGRDDDRLTGQAWTLEIATRDDPISTDSWTPGVVLQLLSTLSRLSLDGGDISTIVRGAETSASTYRAGPILAKLLDRDFFKSELLATSGMSVRIATVALESGELRYMTESGELVDRDNNPIGSSTFDVSRGVLASCSIPGVFRPVDLDGEHYVDGGLRENVPAEMAIGHLGVTNPYVITCSPQGVSRESDYGSRNMLDLVTRSVSILTDETERDEVAYALNAGAVVIGPEISVHDSMTVDPGLLRINRDYGWMCSAEKHVKASSDAHELIKDTVRTRVRGWELEQAWLKEEATRDEMNEMQHVKDHLRDVATRLPLDLAPEGIDTWGYVLEGHGHPSAPEDVVIPWQV